MKKILLLFFTFVTVAIHAQLTTLSGTVVDTKTGDPISGASVTMDGLSVITNEDGFFTLKSDREAKEAEVSHVGYRSQRIRLQGSGHEQLKIAMMPATIQLNEVLVMAKNARELVLAALKKIKVNYSRQPQLYQCFYREKAMKRQHYICVAEGVVDMYKTDYGHNTRNDRVAIRKGRRLMSPKQSDTLSVKVMGGPVLPIMLDIVKNPEILLSEAELELYDMKMEVPTSIADRQQLVVSIAPRATVPYALYYGRLYIDQETLAFTRAELSLDMSNRDKATRAMLVKKPAGLRFRPKELTLLVDYRQGADGVTRMTYLNTTFRFNCDWRRRLFATSFTASCEMAVTSFSDSNEKPISGRESFDQRDAFFDRVDFFRDPDFWKDYNIIEPTESLDKAVGKLLKKHTER